MALRVQDPPPPLWGQVVHPQNTGDEDTLQDPRADPEGPTWTTPLQAPGERIWGSCTGTHGQDSSHRASLAQGSGSVLQLHKLHAELVA